MKDDRGSPGENLEVALEWLKQYKRARLRLSRLFETGRVGRSLGRCSEKRSSEKNVSMHVRPAMRMVEVATSLAIAICT
jgi:hypothetical protein